MIKNIMDGQALDLPSDSFDAVVLHLVLAVIPDPVACMREAVRVLKPSGRIVVFDKFLPDGQQPSAVRRLLNVLTNLLFSDVNRPLGPILSRISITLEHTEPADVLSGLGYRIVLAKKTDTEV